MKILATWFVKIYVYQAVAGALIGFAIPFIQLFIGE